MKDKNENNNWICDCKSSEIRWVDEHHPHISILRIGWFCMGCLTEFIRLESEPKSIKPLNRSDQILID